jgi:hypothetical protein
VRSEGSCFGWWAGYISIPSCPKEGDIWRGPSMAAWRPEADTIPARANKSVQGRGLKRIALNSQVIFWVLIVSLVRPRAGTTKGLSIPSRGTWVTAWHQSRLLMWWRGLSCPCGHFLYSFQLLKAHQCGSKWLTNKEMSDRRTYLGFSWRGWITWNVGPGWDRALDDSDIRPVSHFGACVLCGADQ